MKRFEVRKCFEEIEIGGKIFKLDISDKALERFEEGSRLLLELHKNKEATTVAPVKESLKALINGIFMDSPFDEIYAECGESIVVGFGLMTEVAAYYAELLKGSVNKI